MRKKNYSAPSCYQYKSFRKKKKKPKPILIEMLKRIKTKLQLTVTFSKGPNYIDVWEC